MLRLNQTLRSPLSSSNKTVIIFKLFTGISNQGSMLLPRHMTHRPVSTVLCCTDVQQNTCFGWVSQSPFALRFFICVFPIERQLLPREHNCVLFRMVAIVCLLVFFVFFILFIFWGGGGSLWQDPTRLRKARTGHKTVFCFLCVIFRNLSNRTTCRGAVCTYPACLIQNVKKVQILERPTTPILHQTV